MRGMRHYLNPLYLIPSLAPIIAGWVSAQTTPDLCRAPEAGTHTRWVSPENPTGEKGKGSLTNKGAKGNAFHVIQPGETKAIYAAQGAGIIRRMWFSGSIAKDPEQLRAVRIDMTWDGAPTPAVSAPIGDFFGIAHGLTARYDNALFSSPEARSFVFTIPMPYRTSASITVTNESAREVWLWYDINALVVEKPATDALYFHACWNRVPATTVGEDFVLLPKVEGKGRYLGANIGVIGNPAYRGTWFGEGEVKVYLDGDTDTPTLVGTGTEDYIGSGWGQGEFVCRQSGSLVADQQHYVYAFYRYHIDDPVYFHADCKVTLQQMGNQSMEKVREMIAAGVPLKPVWFLGRENGRAIQGRLLDEHANLKVTDANFPKTGVHIYRSDDVCATAYFYLDKPSNSLPALAPKELRLLGLKDKVWNRGKPAAKPAAPNGGAL